jgi:glycerophosphoryl diester phosphodiesterase
MDCIAHRGSANRVPENSMAGIHYTASHHIKQIECDISVASDGVAVIFHDEYLRRMTGDPRSVLSLTSAELTKIPLISHHVGPTQYIPLADKWMREAANYDLFLHLEIKVHDQEVERVVEAALAAFDRSELMPAQVRVSSFSLDAIQLIRERRPELDVGVAAVRLTDISLDTLQSFDVVSVHLDIDYLDSQSIELAIDRGFKVCVYTVNSAQQLASMPIELIDSVFTDDPLLLNQELKTLKISK